MKKFILLPCLLFLLPIPTMNAQDHTATQDPCPLVSIPPQPQNFCQVIQAISYPEKAVTAQIQGMVQVRVWVNEKGDYLQHEVVQSSHFLLSEAVNQRIAQLEFTPATQNGKVVSACLHLPFIFRLDHPQKVPACPKEDPESPVIVVKSP